MINTFSFEKALLFSSMSVIVKLKEKNGALCLGRKTFNANYINDFLNNSK